MLEKINKKQMLYPGKTLLLIKDDPFSYSHQNWKLFLEKNCETLIIFDAAGESKKFGKDSMNKKFLKIIKNHLPKRVFLLGGTDELHLETLEKTKNLFPKIILFTYFGDDDQFFDNLSKYVALFVDVCLVSQKKFIKKYQEGGLKNIFYFTGVNTEFFKQLNLKKKYDVTFIGGPLSNKSGRVEYLEFLMKNKVNLKIFGKGWEKYSQFKEIYGGTVDCHEMVKIINQSKISLSFSKNVYGGLHLKARTFECGACNSFTLVEKYENYLDLFSKKDLETFTNKKELLNKIKYFLDRPKERNRISKKLFDKISKNYGSKNEVEKIKKSTSINRFEKWSLPNIKKHVIYLSKTDLEKNYEEIKNKLEKYDYVSFKEEGVINSKHKDLLQIYSLEKSKKEISCCDYIVYKKNLGDFIRFDSKKGFYDLNYNEFNKFLKKSQLMIAKNFFLKNLLKFNSKRGLNKNLITEKNTVFISFPLLKLKNLKLKRYSILKKACRFYFPQKIYSLKYQKKLFRTLFLPSLFLEIIRGNFFILQVVFSSLKKNFCSIKFKKTDS
jgi:hypothetical protein